ncbi:MAG: flagellar motor switch protein FliN [Alphaproteobacteria bacterium]|nr:flagellar motor switch protein FliN [Alphaproteobacteria bacterium]
MVDDENIQNEQGTEENNSSEREENIPSAQDLGAIYDVPVEVTAILGKADLHVNQLLKLGRGAVIELDRKVGEAIDIYVNNRLVARGEIVVMEDEQIGITMTEIIKSDAAA